MDVLLLKAWCRLGRRGVRNLTLIKVRLVVSIMCDTGIYIVGIQRGRHKHR